MHARRCPFSRDRSLYYGNSPARLVARPLRLRLKLCRDFGLPVSGAGGIEGGGGGIESRWRRRWRGGRRGSGHLSRRRLARRRWWLRRRSPREGGGQQDSASGGRRCPITRFPTTGGTTGDPYITACMHCALSSSSPPVKRRQCYDRHETRILSATYDAVPAGFGSSRPPLRAVLSMDGISRIRMA
jgi:hypothetical protein